MPSGYWKIVCTSKGVTFFCKRGVPQNFPVERIVYITPRYLHTRRDMQRTMSTCDCGSPASALAHRAEPEAAPPTTEVAEPEKIPPADKEAEMAPSAEGIAETRRPEDHGAVAEPEKPTPADKEQEAPPPIGEVTKTEPETAQAEESAEGPPPPKRTRTG